MTRPHIRHIAGSALITKAPAFILVTVLVALGLSGCGSVLADNLSRCRPVPAFNGRGLAIVVGAHQGAPAPRLPASQVALLEGAVETGVPITLVALDGAPRVVSLPRLTISETSCDAYPVAIAGAVNAIASTIGMLRPHADGNDVLGGIKLAYDSIPKGGTILVVDNLLSDVPPVNFATPGMTAASPVQVATFVHRVEPALTLRGSHIVLVGAGTSVARPQAALNAVQRAGVVQIVVAVLSKLGAQVVVDPHPVAAVPPVASRYSVHLVPVTNLASFVPPTVGHPVTQVFSAANGVDFLPNSNVLRSPTAAREAIRKVARWLIGHPAGSVEIVGTTSSDGTSQGRAERSLGRASVVSTLLREDGVPGRQIGSVKGVGYDFAGRVDDRDSSGRLVSRLATQNMTVRLTLMLR